MAEHSTDIGVHTMLNTSILTNNPGTGTSS